MRTAQSQGLIGSAVLTCIMQVVLGYFVRKDGHAFVPDLWFLGGMILYVTSLTYIVLATLNINLNGAKGYSITSFLIFSTLWLSVAVMIVFPNMICGILWPMQTFWYMVGGDMLVGLMVLIQLVNWRQQAIDAG